MACGVLRSRGESRNCRSWRRDPVGWKNLSFSSFERCMLEPDIALVNLSMRVESRECLKAWQELLDSSIRKLPHTLLNEMRVYFSPTINQEVKKRTETSGISLHCREEHISSALEGIKTVRRIAGPRVDHIFQQLLNVTWFFFEIIETRVRKFLRTDQSMRHIASELSTVAPC